MRCRCDCGGVPCLRQATQEDARCDVCRHGGTAGSGGLVSPYAAGTDFYAAGRVGGLFEARVPPLELPRRYERSLVEGYRLGLSVRGPVSLVAVTGT